MLKSLALTPNAASAKTDLLEGLDDQALLTLRHRIDARLKIDLTQLNLADELGLQYRAGMVLLSSIQDEKNGTPANQRAQVFNSVGAMLEKIVKQQKVVFNAERLKRFESAFLRVLDEMPPESKRKFFDMYGEYLSNDGKPNDDSAPEAVPA